MPFFSSWGKVCFINSIWFFWFSSDIGFFRKKTFEIFIVEICEVEIGMVGRNRCCRFYNHRILSLLWKNVFSSNLEGDRKQNFLSVPTMLEYSYQFKNILLGYTFPNISKTISLFLPPQFHYKFCESYCGQSRFVSWQPFCIKKCYI